jgi:hypothetical protein
MSAKSFEPDLRYPLSGSPFPVGEGESNSGDLEAFMPAENAGGRFEMGRASSGPFRLIEIAIETAIKSAIETAFGRTGRRTAKNPPGGIKLLRVSYR